MSKPKISVIMSEYNTPPDYLRASIESILNQTFKDIEIIIVDDCGRNDLSSIVKEYKDKRVLFGGRLGEYRYYDLENTIKSAIELADKIVKEYL